MTLTPVPFEIYQDSVLLHGTKAALAAGDLLEAGHWSSFGRGHAATFVYVTATLDAAVWGAELAGGDGPSHIYVVEPTGDLEDDPNVTDAKFPGNPTRSYRTREPVRVMAEVLDWTGHPPEQVRAMRERLEELRQAGVEAIDD